MVTTTWTQTAGMTSDTETDNIADYAEQAEASKDAAAASETASANSAVASASSASGSSTSAAEALASKNAAATSETNAAASASTAATQASNSSTSATASETSRVASVAAQAAAETAETAAETAQTAAEAAEAGVATDAATATAQAAIATTQATNSGTSATASEASRVAAVAAQAAAETAETNAETAETNAETAQTAAEAAETSASGFSTSASASASTATTQAGIATTKAGEAAASATASASSATASEAAKDAALSALDNFQDQYLGDFATDPTTDNDGDPLQAGMLYFNTTDDVMKVYTGSAWVAAYASLSGALLTSNNLSDLNNAATARTNLGLGTAATTAASAYATSAQGALADSAVQPNDSPTFGSVTVTGTVDGRDVAADGTKLDGIEAGATADQTKADIDALGIAASTASTLATARNIAVTGAVTGNADFDGSGNISISTTATSDPTVTLTGAVTGSGTMTNLGNVSIATTATADPTLTLSGDASGSATFTNLGNATLSVTVADDSHNHVISNVDGLQTALDGKQAAGTYNTVIGTDTDIDTSGSTIIDNIYVTDGVITSMGTRTLTLADLGYTGATNANYITNNNQLTNGAGYTTYTANQSVNTSSSPTFADVYNNGWFRSNGTTGWYSQTYAGGIYMEDSTWVRIYNSKQFLVDNKAKADNWQEVYTGLSGTGPTIDADTAGAFSLTMSGNTTFTFSGVDSGTSVGFILQLTGNGSTVTWPGTVDWAGGTAPDAPASGASNLYVFYTRDGGSNWIGVLSSAAYA